MTDTATVENVLAETFATFVALAKEGKSLKLNFKVGSLHVSNARMFWTHSRDILRRSGLMVSHDNSALEQTTVLGRDRLSIMDSVLTPSQAKFSRVTSTDYKNFHMSNPNPQATVTRFRGARDLKSTERSEAGSDYKAADFVKFGKRIAFGPKVTNEEVLEAHLAQMREHREHHKQAKE